MKRAAILLVVLLVAGGAFVAGRMTGGTSDPGQGAGGKSQDQGKEQAGAGDGGQAHDIALSDAASQAIDLQTAKVQTGAITHRLTIPAFVQADPARSAALRPIDEGRVLGVFARTGAHVAKGAILVTIADPRALDAASRVSTIRGAYLRARATETDARAAAARGDALAGGVVSDGEALRRRMAARQASAETASQHAALGDAEIALAAYAPVPGRPGVSAIAAPVDGTVLSLTAGIGDIVDPTHDIGAVADLSHVWVLATVFQADIGRIDATRTAMITVPGVATGIAVPIDDIGNSVDPRTGGVMVRLVVPNPDRAFRPGMTCSAALPTTTRRDALLVPDEAVQDVNGRKTVFVATAHGKFAPTPVQTGVETPGHIEIVDGLSAGQDVVTKGSFALKSQSMQAELGAGN